MRYGTVIPGRFVDRPNRFVAHVETAEGLQTVHVKNTGRCRELLLPGAPVYLERGTRPGRKTLYDLIAVEKGAVLINMDAQAPNRVFGEWVQGGGFLPEVTAVRILEHFGMAEYFDRICGAPLDNQEGARKANVIRRALSCAEAPAVMVGDRRHDVAGAHQAGLACIGVLYGYGSREEHEAAGADFIAEDLTQLRRLLLYAGPPQ